MRKVAFTFLVFSFTLSCSPRLDVVNDNFIKEYGSQVARINQERNAFEKEQKAPEYIKRKKTYGWNDPAIIVGAAGTYKYKSAYIDTSQLKLKPPAEQFLPDAGTLNQNLSYQRLPENMFEIKYLAVNYPEAYGIPPISFDDISIPSRDAYGIDSSLGEKNYDLLNGKVLQKSVDNINNNTAYDDKEIRLILVKEQKELDRKKRLRLLKSKNEEILKEENSQKNQSKSESTIN